MQESLVQEPQYEEVHIDLPVSSRYQREYEATLPELKKRLPHLKFTAPSRLRVMLANFTDQSGENVIKMQQIIEGSIQDLSEMALVLEKPKVDGRDPTILSLGFSVTGSRAFLDYFTDLESRLLFAAGGQSFNLPPKGNLSCKIAIVAKHLETEANLKSRLGSLYPISRGLPWDFTPERVLLFCFGSNSLGLFPQEFKPMINPTAA